MFLVYIAPDVSAFFRFNDSKETIVWREMCMDDAQQPPIQKKTTKRDLLWLRQPASSAKQSLVTRKQPTLHPLRTDVWHLELRRQSWKSTVRVEFSPTGRVRGKYERDTHWMLGTWGMSPNGQLHWTLSSFNKESFAQSFFADLHLHPYGKQPRLSRGVVIDETLTNKWRRKRIVATFRAQGLVKDDINNNIT
jgi:hypothetical protein